MSSTNNHPSESGIDWDLEYRLSAFGVSFEEDDMSEFYDPDNVSYLHDDFSQMSLQSENPTEETFLDAQMSLDRALEASRYNNTTTSIPTATTTTISTSNNITVQFGPSPINPLYGVTSSTTSTFNNNVRRPSLETGTNVGQSQQQVVSGKSPPVNYSGTVVDLRSGRSNSTQQGHHHPLWQDSQQYFDTYRPPNQEVSSSSRLGSSTNPSSSLLGLASGNISIPQTSSQPVASIRKTPIQKNDRVTIQEKRKRAVESLSLEPNENDENVICIAILLPNGQRVKRRFLKTDSLTVLKAFIWSHKKVPDKFEVSTNYPRRILHCTRSITFEEAGINSNELLYVTPAVPSSTS